MGVVYTDPPQSRNEAILDSIVDGTPYTDPPQSRIEDLLLQVKEVIEEGGHDESATRASIAPTESDSAHASKNIAVGEQFYLSDDKLYTATSAISQGSAIVVYPTSGYNCKLSDSVTGQIQAQEQLLEDTVGWISDEQAKLYNWTGDSQGITFAYTKEQVTVNGTALANTSQPSSSTVPEDGKYTLKAGTYKFVSDADNVVWQAIGTNPVVLIGDSRKPITITEDTNVFIRAYINSGISFNNKVVHVSLRKLSVDETKADNSVIGTVEDGATASQAYSVNDLFIRSGKIGKATTSIAQGEPLTLGTNYTETTIGAILTGLLNA